MFSDEILEKIFAHPETKKIPIDSQSVMIRIIEEVFEEMGVSTNAAVSKYES